AVFLATAVAALSAGAGLIWREQRRTNEHKQNAERGWARAEENLGLARGLTEDLLDISENHLARTAQAQATRARAIDTALQACQQSLQRRPDDPDARELSAKLYRYSANAHRLLNEADVARPSYQNAVRVLDGLIAEQPGEPSYQNQLAETLRDYSQLLMR